jgi:hypothetical protein
VLKMQALCDLARVCWFIAVEQVSWNVMKMAAARFSERSVNVC